MEFGVKMNQIVVSAGMDCILAGVIFITIAYLSWKGYSK